MVTIASIPLIFNWHNYIGDITIPDGVSLTVDSDLNGASPQFTLTCISIGGPATTVIWTRDSASTMGDETINYVFEDSTYSQLDDPVTAHYTHTLTVTGWTEGLYQCNVSNSKPSSAAAQLCMQGIAYEIQHSESCFDQRCLFNIMKRYLMPPRQPPPLPLV